MKKVKCTLLWLSLSLMFLPIGGIFAQEEEIVTTTEEEQPILYEEYEDIPEEPILDESYDYDIDPSIYETTDISTTLDEGAFTIFWTLFTTYLLVILTLGLGGYIFSSLALQKIGKDMKYENDWYAWIPIFNTVMVFELGKQNPWILLAMLVPGIGQLIVAVFGLLALMEITEKRGYEKILAILIFIPFGMFVLLYLLAWKPKELTIPLKQ